MAGWRARRQEAGGRVAFVVEVERSFRARQGLPSPIRAARGLPSVPATEVVLRVVVAFEDDQLTARGWFFDTDAAGLLLDGVCEDLGGRPWTEIFDFRPTFELVARELFHRLSAEIPQLHQVELVDRTFGSTTRYGPGRLPG